MIRATAGVVTADVVLLLQYPNTTAKKHLHYSGAAVPVVESISVNLRLFLWSESNA